MQLKISLLRRPSNRVSNHGRCIDRVGVGSPRLIASSGSVLFSFSFDLKVFRVLLLKLQSKIQHVQPERIHLIYIQTPARLVKK